MQIEGLYNFRDLGGYPIANFPNKIIRPGVVYRSADPSKITELGISQVQALNITRVFDLRSEFEIEQSTQRGFGQVREWDGAERIVVSVFKDDDDHHIPGPGPGAGRKKRRDENLKREGIEVYSKLKYGRTDIDCD